MNSTVLCTVGFWPLCNSRDVLLFCASSVPTSSARYPSGCAAECLSSSALSLLFSKAVTSNHRVFKFEKEIDANNKKDFSEELGGLFLPLPERQNESECVRRAKVGTLTQLLLIFHF